MGIVDARNWDTEVENVVFEKLICGLLIPVKENFNAIVEPAFVFTSVENSYQFPIVKLPKVLNVPFPLFT